MRQQPRTRSWIDGTNLVLGMAVFCLPWVVGPATQAANWNAWTIGGLVAFNATCALIGFSAWEEWTNVVLGSWTAISPWIFGFGAHVGSAWTYVTLGCAVAALAAAQLWLLYQQPGGPYSSVAGRDPAHGGTAGRA